MIHQDRLVEVADGLEAYLCAQVGCTVVTKEASALHQGIADAFDKASLTVDLARGVGAWLSIDVPALGLPTGDEYLSNFGTTIGRVIALPRAWRAPAGALQRIPTLPHEALHVHQFVRGVDMGWYPKITTHTVLYLASIAGGDGAEYVGHVEGDAYAVTEAVRTWLGGTRRPINSIADSLRRHYALAGVGVVVAEATLVSHYKTMEKGGIPNIRVCRLAIDWLEANARDIKGKISS